ncbi:hypothetical protein TcCL_Unassigned04268 [Trypanosoma cruzi]|nr:hypothetical protein TcCL_Unassigned04268 [Trypanosoma cruzi]
MNCRRNHATAMRPSFGPPKKKHVSRSPREQHTLNRIQLHYCGHPHSQQECDNAGKEARNNSTHPSHKGFAVSVLPSTIIPPHITLLHIRSKKAHTVCTTLEVPNEQTESSECCPLLNVKYKLSDPCRRQPAVLWRSIAFSAYLSIYFTFPRPQMK